MVITRRFFAVLVVVLVKYDDPLLRAAVFCTYCSVL
jgi:hypothetical protein